MTDLIRLVSDAADHLTDDARCFASRLATASPHLVPSEPLRAEVHLLLRRPDELVSDDLETYDWSSVERLRLVLATGLSQARTPLTVLRWCEAGGFAPHDAGRVTVQGDPALQMLLARDLRRHHSLAVGLARATDQLAGSLNHERRDLPRTTFLGDHPEGWLRTELPTVPFDPRWAEDGPLLRLSSPRLVIATLDGLAATDDTLLQKLVTSGAVIAVAGARVGAPEAPVPITVMGGEPPLSSRNILDRWQDTTDVSASAYLERARQHRHLVDHAGLHAFVRRLGDSLGRPLLQTPSVLSVTTAETETLADWQGQHVAGPLLSLTPDGITLRHHGGPVDDLSTTRGRGLTEVATIARATGCDWLTVLEPGVRYGPEHLRDICRSILLAGPDVVIRRAATRWDDGVLRWTKPVPVEQRAVQASSDWADAIAVRVDDLPALARHTAALTTIDLLRASRNLGLVLHSTHGCGLTALQRTEDRCGSVVDEPSALLSASNMGQRL